MTQRLFLAVALSDDMRAGLLAHLEDNDGGRIPGKHVVPANWHLTLRFLGATGDVERDVLVARLDDSIGGGPFRVTFGGLGAFPRPRRAAVAWLAVRGGEERLAELAARCEDAAQAIGKVPEGRPFHAHLTLSRIRPPHPMDELIDEFPAYPGVLDVDRIVLYESRLRGRQPPEYAVVEEFPL